MDDNQVPENQTEPIRSPLRSEPERTGLQRESQEEQSVRYSDQSQDGNSNESLLMDKVQSVPEEPNINGGKRVIRNPDGTFAEGSPGGPGRPKGSISIKDLVRQHLSENPEDLKEFVKHFIKKNRELAWQMLEGRPPQDLTSKGESLIPTPIMGINHVSINNGDPEDRKAIQADQGSTGGDVGKQDSLNPPAVDQLISE